MNNRIDRNKIVLLIFVSFFLLQQCGSDGSNGQGVRPAHWGVAVQREGLPNLFKVTDNLYRGAQPKKEGIVELKKLGIKTIVNLRGSNKDRKLLKGYDFKYIHIPVNTLFPGREEFEQFLEIVTDPGNWPVFVHCKHGADRTGTAVALFRIKVQKWETEAAIEEMVEGGYNFHRIHQQLKRFIRKY